MPIISPVAKQMISGRSPKVVARLTEAATGEGKVVGSSKIPATHPIDFLAFLSQASATVVLDGQPAPPLGPINLSEAKNTSPNSVEGARAGNESGELSSTPEFAGQAILVRVVDGLGSANQSSSRPGKVDPADIKSGNGAGQLPHEDSGELAVQVASSAATIDWANANSIPGGESHPVSKTATQQVGGNSPGNEAAIAKIAGLSKLGEKNAIENDSGTNRTSESIDSGTTRITPSAKTEYSAINVLSMRMLSSGANYGNGKGEPDSARIESDASLDRYHSQATEVRMVGQFSGSGIDQMPGNVVVAGRVADSTSTYPPVADQISKAMIAHAEFVTSPGRTDFYLQLEPPNLGMIHIHLSATEHQLMAQVVVSHESTQALISSQVHDLRLALAQVGITLGGFDVTQGGGGSQGKQEQPPPPNGHMNGLPHPKQVLMPIRTESRSTDAVDILA